MAQSGQSNRVDRPTPARPETCGPSARRCERSRELAEDHAAVEPDRVDQKALGARPNSPRITASPCSRSNSRSTARSWMHAREQCLFSQVNMAKTAPNPRWPLRCARYESRGTRLCRTRDRMFGGNGTAATRDARCRGAAPMPVSGPSRPEPGRRGAAPSGMRACQPLVLAQVLTRNADADLTTLPRWRRRTCLWAPLHGATPPESGNFPTWPSFPMAGRTSRCRAKECLAAD